MFCPYCGKEINDNADICLGCGRSVSNVKKASCKDSNSVGWWWLGFFFPFVGLILWLVWTGSTPMRAKRTGWGALVGAIVSVVLSILLCIAIFGLSFAIGMNIAEIAETTYI